MKAAALSFGLLLVGLTLNDAAGTVTDLEHVPGYWVVRGEGESGAWGTPEYGRQIASRKRIAARFTVRYRRLWVTHECDVDAATWYAVAVGERFRCAS